MAAAQLVIEGSRSVHTGLQGRADEMARRVDEIGEQVNCIPRDKVALYVGALTPIAWAVAFAVYLRASDARSFRIARSPFMHSLPIFRSLHLRVEYRML